MPIAESPKRDEAKLASDQMTSKTIALSVLAKLKLPEKGFETSNE